MTGIRLFAGHVGHALLLNIAYIGVADGLLVALAAKQPLAADELARETAMDAGYVHRWYDAAYAFELIDADADRFRLTGLGDAFRPDRSDNPMPFAVQSILSAHMAERATALMRTREHPGESVLAERETILPWFGPMLEQQFGPLFDREILPKFSVFEEVDRKQGLVVDVGCGSGWYLRILVQRYQNIRGMGLDGFEENIQQTQMRATDEGVGDRLQFTAGNIHDFRIHEPADAGVASRMGSTRTRV